MRPLDRLLRPRSIAVIGGGKWGANVVAACRRIGFAGPIRPVHSQRAEVGGLPAVASVEALPEPPDAAFVAVNRLATVEAVRALAARGAGGAVCFAAGFREAAAELADGAALQAALVEAAGEMPFLGPNCYGVLNYLDGAALWPDQHGGERVERGVALVAQSSNIAMNLTMQRRGLPLAYVVAAGNQAQTGLSAIGAALLADPRVTALGLHIEGIDDLRGLEALAATARRLGKPVAALKVGRSEGGRAATVSHTASLAGGEAGAAALLDRLGIRRAPTLPALLETLKLLHVAGPLRSARVAAMACSGGEAGLMADAAEGSRLSFPPLAPAQRARLRAVLGPAAALGNPLDYQTRIWGDAAAKTEVFSAMLDGEIGLACLILDMPRADRCEAEAWERALEAAEAARRPEGPPLAVVSTLPECLPEPVARRVVAAGMAPLCGLEEAVRAIAAAASPPPPPAPPVLAPRPARAPRLLSEAEGKAALAAHGLRVPRSARAASPAAAAEAAAALGFPVALKGEGLAHKTEAGAVALDLRDRSAVEAAGRAMPAEAFLVEEMVRGVCELLVGVVCDPPHGYALTLAAGGVHAELRRDAATLLVPAPPEAVRRALEGLRLAPILAGWRGAPAADMASVLRAVAAVQSYVEAEAGRLAEVEINPLICGPSDAVAADVLIRIGDRDG